MPPVTTPTRDDAPVKAPNDAVMLAAWVRDLAREAKSHRAPLVAEWQRNYRILHNRSWGQRAEHLPAPEISEIWPLVASHVAWMTDQRPTFTFSPISDRTSESSAYLSQLADDLGFLAKAHWQNYDYDAWNEMMLWDCATYGTGILKTLWDPRLANGKGDPSVRRVDPWSFLVDPAATSMMDANYFIEVRHVSLQELDRRFPNSFAMLSRSAFKDSIDEAPNSLLSRAPSFANPMVLPPATGPSTALRQANEGGKLQFLRHQGVTTYEAWIREHERVDGRTVDYWRCVIVAGNTVLLDKRATDLWRHGSHPYDRCVAIETGEFWEQSMVGLLSSPQIELNRMLAAVLHNIWLAGNPVLTEQVGSGIPRTQITNKPGQRLTHNAGQKPEWLVPPQIQQQIPGQIFQYLISRMQNTVGQSAIANGQALPGRNSTDTIDTIQESGFNRIRLSLRNWERTLRSASRKWASLIAEFYDEPRFTAFTAGDGKDEFRMFASKHFHGPTPYGYGPVDFAVLADAGSSLPTSQSALSSLAISLFQFGAIDRQELLERLRWPNRFQALQRINALEAQGQFNPPLSRSRASS